MRELIDKIFSSNEKAEKSKQSSNVDDRSNANHKKPGESPLNEVEGEAIELAQDDKANEAIDIEVDQARKEGDDESALNINIMSGVEAESDQDPNGKLPETKIGTLAVNQSAVPVPEDDSGKAMVSPMLQANQRCHIGKVRSRNEDSSYIFTAETGGQEPLIPFGLYVVADGMGGHHAGHEASKKVSRLVAQHVLERIYVPLLRNSTVGDGAPPEPVGEVMLDAVQEANQHIHSPDPGKDSGTTLTAALVFGRRLYVAHVGDSRAYLLLNGELKQVTTDHSYVRRLQDAGQLSDEEAAIHPQRNMLYRAVGQGGELDIETFTRSLPENGKLLLCSDGLWGLVSDSDFKNLLEQDISLELMTSRLVEQALKAGGHDNITVILVEFGF